MTLNNLWMTDWIYSLVNTPSLIVVTSRHLWHKNYGTQHCSNHSVF